MYLDILQELGLSPNESKIYEALLELGESSVSSIATRTNVHRRNVYDAVNRLVEKGVIIPVIESKENRYIPIEPNKFLEILEEKRIQLEKVLPSMQETYAEKSVPEGIYIYKGKEGLKNIARDILRVGETCYTIGGKSIWTIPASVIFGEYLTLRHPKWSKIKFYTLCDAGVRNKFEKMEKDSNMLFRFLPEKYSSASALDIYGDRVVTYTGKGVDTLEERLTIFMMISKKVADSYKQWFQFMWDHCAETSKPKRVN